MFLENNDTNLYILGKKESILIFFPPFKKSAVGLLSNGRRTSIGKCGPPCSRHFVVCHIHACTGSPLGHGMLRKKNGNPGNGRKSQCFHKSETLGYPFLLFEKGQGEKCVCVSLESGQAFLIIYQDSEDIVCMKMYLMSGKKSCKIIPSFLGFL